MKGYPSIPRDVQHSLHVYAFDKLDGSQIRAEWTRKNGFFKFGSRRVLINGSHPLGKAVGLLQDKYADDLGRIFRKSRYDKVTCFFEFFGPSSFAGQHVENEDHNVVLFDVDVYKKGLLDPPDYLKLVGDLDIAPLLYTGRSGPMFEETVRNSQLEGMTFEGVVCKTLQQKRTPVMFKIKSRAWLDKLREFCAGDQKMFDLLK
jgi:hypothetical protein